MGCFIPPLLKSDPKRRDYIELEAGACVEGFQVRSDMPDNDRTQTTLLETSNVLLGACSV